MKFVVRDASCNEPVVDNEIIKELIDYEAKLSWQKTNLLPKNSY